MSAIPQPFTAPPLSARLTEPLRKVAERQWIFRLAQALLQLTVLTLAVWLAVVLTLGGWPAIPVPLRLLLAGIAWGSFLLAAGRLLRPAFRKRGLRTAARDVESALPEIQERLSSAVELLAEPDPRFRGSPELIAHLVRQAEAAAQDVDPITVISSRSVVRWFLLCLPLLAAWAIIAATSPAAVARGLRQTLLPWSTPAAVPPIQFTVTPGNVDLAQGDPLTIAVQLTPTESTPAPEDADAERPPLLVSHYPGGQVASQPMNRTGPHAYEWPIDHVLQGFTYQITTGPIDSSSTATANSTPAAESPLYTVHVLTRPAAQSLDLEYHFPAYTGMPTRTEKNTDGAIDALVGTRVRITVHANQPLTNRSRLIFAPDSPDQRIADLQPVPTVASPTAPQNAAPHANTSAPDTSTSDYTADLTLPKPGQFVYRLALVSSPHTSSTNPDSPLELTNDNDSPRPVLIRPDAPPHIAILSPEPTIKIRPDDTALVRYNAGDDFSVAHVLVRIQIDDHPAQVTQLPLAPDRGHDFTAQWPLSVPDQLQRQGLRDAHRLTYQLKAVDNRVPNPQEAVTPLHTLDLDAAVAPLAARQDEKSAQDLATAIQQAHQTLDDAQKQVDALRQTPANQPLSPPQLADAEATRNQLSAAARQLAAAAHQAREGPFANQAQDAEKTAQEPVKTAADDLAKTALAADQPAAQHENLDHAAAQIAEARRQLDALSGQTTAAARDQQLARTLEDLAQKQSQAADAQAAAQTKDPAAAAQARAQQQQLQQQLDQTIRDNPNLQNAAAGAAQPRAQDLQKKLDDLQNAQKPLTDEAQKQASAAGATARVPDIAKDQQKLNQDIADFNNRQSQTLKDAAAKPPDQPQLDAIDKNLEQNKLVNAAQQQRATATALDQAAEKAAQAARHDQDIAQQRQAAAAKNQQAVQDAAKAQAQADQLAKNAEAAKTQPAPPQSLEAAKRQAQQNQQQQELAQQIEKQADALAARDPHQKPAMNEVKKTAEQASQDAAKGKTEDAQQKLASASQALSQAAQQSARDNDPAAAQAAQQQQAQTAKEAADLAARQAKLAEQTTAAESAKESASDRQDQAAANAARQEQHAQQLDQAAQDARQLQRDSQSTAPGVADRAGKAADALTKSAQSERQAAQQQTDPTKAADAQKSQDEADRQLAAARQSLQPSSPPPDNAPSGQQQPSPSNQQANQQPGQQSGQQPGQQSAQQPGQQNGQQITQQPGAQPGTPSSLPSIAQKILQARAAQQRAADGDPTAARQAADDLSAAARQIAQAPSPGQPQPNGASPSPNPSPSSSSPGNPGQSPSSAQQTASNSASNSTPPSSTPGASSSRGIGPGAGPLDPGPLAADSRPDAVKEIGISPSDWAHLPALAQQQLLNAAQQKGPPAYQEMVKNYYLRIARLQSADPETH